MAMMTMLLSVLNAFGSLIGITCFVLTVVASWILYTKADEPGWAAIIPFFSSYTMFKIAGKKKLFWGNLVCMIAVIVTYIIILVEALGMGINALTYSYSYSYSYSYPGYMSSGSIAAILISAVVLLVASIAMLVFRILMCIGLSKVFGKGAGYACGLIFLNPIFLCIMAFNKNIVYVGENGNRNNDNYYNPYGQNAYGANQPYGQQQYGQNPYGANQPYGQQYSQNPYGANQPYGQQQYNQNAYGANQQYGQQQYSQNPYGGNQPYGQQQYSQNTYSQAGTQPQADAQSDTAKSWDDVYSNKDFD